MKFKGFTEINTEGFEVKIACDKLVNLCVKSVSITEYKDTCGIYHSKIELPVAITKNEAIAQGEKPTFEKCISLLPLDMQSEITDIDEYFKTLKPLKFKRTIEKNGNKITYIESQYGFSYAIYLSNDVFDHSLQWYIITNGKPETWHRKADVMEEILDRLFLKSPNFAERMFSNLDDCVGCYKNCLARTKYKLRDNHKDVCHGKLKFKMNKIGFEDLRIFILEIKQFVQETIK